MKNVRSIYKALLLSALAASVSACLPTKSAADTTVSRTSDFLDSIGVNAHVEYTDSRYARMDQVIHALQFTGITYVRDAAPWHGNQGQSGYGALAATGVKFDLFMNRSLAPQLSELRNLVVAHPGSVDTIEGPNEVNNFPIHYMGQSGTVAAIAYQDALYTQVKADPLLRAIPVLNFTDWPVHSGQSDLGNVHSYPKRGAQPSKTLSRDINESLAVLPNSPILCTETGYHTLASGKAKDGVPDSLQAVLIANTLLDNFSNHIKRTYIYELLDEFADPTNSDDQKHFGLFNVDYTPKPSAILLHNIHSILGNDPNPTLPPTAINVAISGGRYVVLSRSDGRHFLILWQEPPLWDSDAKLREPVPPIAIQIRFDQPRDTSTYSPMTSAEATHLGVQRTFTLSLEAAPLIVAF
jgi:hypothetical protein